MADNQENPPKRTKYEWGSLGRDGVRAAMEITMEEWSSMEADGGIAMLPEGAGQRAINQLGSPVHVHCCPTGTTEFLSLGSNGNEEPSTGPVQATLSALTQRMSQHAPKFLILCGSLRKESYTRKLAVEVGRILAGFGAEVKLFDPEGLPLFSEDVDTQSNPKVTELRMLTRWCEGMVWISPEIHGNYAGVFKNQVDWMPLSHGGQRPTQGKTVAVMQVEGGSQSFNVVNNLRVLGRWMRCVVIPNQSSIPQVQKYFAPDGTMVDSPYRDRVVDVVEELYKFTLLLRDQQPYLLCRYGEQK